MGDFFGNLSVIFGGVGGMLIGFLLLALVFVVAFLPFLFWLRRPERPVQHTGLEHFAASLDTPDEGYDDRIPPKTRPSLSQSSSQLPSQLPSQSPSRPQAVTPSNAPLGHS
ncbi:MAG: hypothetical protein NDI61_04560 [Bdellovibrionaceae bacterium]|nr:hypothetical protein [Pseudobdellovibrionaceae bacterium]